jgi:membrane protease YdiL (CAAX protease family)
MIQGLGLSLPASWLSTIGWALVWLALMLAFSPLADRIATRLVARPPNLGAFRMLQQSRARLVLGIVVAWALGGFLEELVFRGIVLRWIDALLSVRLAGPVAAGIAVCAAAAGAGFVHSYQGPRAVIVVTQLSVLFGLLFVLSGFDLWTVILCHGLYDTVAFVRFATGRSRDSRLHGNP